VASHVPGGGTPFESGHHSHRPCGLGGECGAPRAAAGGTAAGGPDDVEVAAAGLDEVVAAGLVDNDVVGRPRLAALHASQAVSTQCRKYSVTVAWPLVAMASVQSIAILAARTRFLTLPPTPMALKTFPEADAVAAATPISDHSVVPIVPTSVIALARS